MGASPGLERIERKRLVYYRNRAWPRLAHGIFTRHGGVSGGQWASLNVGGSNGDRPERVRENQRRMAAALNVKGQNAVTAWLVHSVDVVVVERAEKRRGLLGKADGLITRLPDVPLVMRFADCVPLLFYDRGAGVIGLAHAGWRGTVQGMAAAMVRKMQACFGCAPADIEVVMGPAISQRNYQVGGEVAAAATAYFGAQPGLICRDQSDGSAYLDLWRANQLDLERSGVRSIECLRICTCDGRADFYSHRGEAGATGRFGVVMSL